MDENSVSNINSLIDREAAPVIAYIPDLHVATDALREVSMELLKRAAGRNAHIVLSDMDEKKTRMEVAHNLGLPTIEDYIANTVVTNLEGDEDRDTFHYLFMVDFYGGIDRYINLVRDTNPTFDVEREVKRYNERLNYSRESGLEGKIQNIVSENQEEISQGVGQIRAASVALDRAISRYNMEKIAREVESINTLASESGLGQLKVIAGGGNHDNEYDVSILQEELGSDVVRNAHDLEGIIELGDDESAIRFQIAGNCYGISQHFDSQAYVPEEIMALYPHMNDKGAIVEDFDPRNLPHITKQDALRSQEYRRMRKGAEEGENLDFLLLHMETGEPVGYEGSPYPNLDSVGILYTINNHLTRDSEGLARVYSGHLHGEANKKDFDWGIRKHRNYATIIDKHGEHILDISSRHPKLEYDMDRIGELLNEEYDKLVAQYQAANDDSYAQTIAA